MYKCLSKILNRINMLIYSGVNLFGILGDHCSRVVFKILYVFKIERGLRQKLTHVGKASNCSGKAKLYEIKFF